MEEKIFPYSDKIPKIAANVFLASGTKIIGDVEIGENSSIWYNTVVRGDVNYIRIGELTNIQDNSVLHVTGKNPLIVGNKVTVGHSAVLHGCTIMDFTLIGIGGIILDSAVVEEKSMVAACSVVKPGFVVPSGKFVAGIPAKVIRDLTNDELMEFENSALRYKKYAEISLDSIKNRY
jgi:carbonic anhydrase/acetyltransferase-like protein (isoleucine patch superfamily)